MITIKGLMVMLINIITAASIKPVNQFETDTPLSSQSAITTEIPPTRTLTRKVEAFDFIFIFQYMLNVKKLIKISF